MNKKAEDEGKEPLMMVSFDGPLWQSVELILEEKESREEERGQPGDEEGAVELELKKEEDEKEDDEKEELQIYQEEDENEERRSQEYSSELECSESPNSPATSKGVTSSLNKGNEKTEEADLQPAAVPAEHDSSITVDRLQSALESAIEELQIREEELSEAKYDVRVLTNEKNSSIGEVKKIAVELDKVKGEFSLLRQDRNGIERALKDSQYKEKEAIMFLKQMRVEYRRLQQQISKGASEDNLGEGEESSEIVSIMIKVRIYRNQQ